MIRRFLFPNMAELFCRQPEWHHLQTNRAWTPQ